MTKNKKDVTYISNSRVETKKQLTTFPNVIREMYVGRTDAQKKVICELSGINDFSFATAVESVKTLRKRVLTNHNTATLDNNKVIFVNKRNIYYSIGANGEVLKGTYYVQTTNYNNIIHRAAKNVVNHVTTKHDCVVNVVYDIKGHNIGADNVHVWRKTTDKITGAESYEYKGTFVSSIIDDDDNGYIATPKMIEG